MILLFISIILSILKIFNVISWSWWIVASPAIVIGFWSTLIFVRTEIRYLKEYNKENKE